MKHCNENRPFRRAEIPSRVFLYHAADTLRHIEGMACGVAARPNAMNGDGLFNKNRELSQMRQILLELNGILQKSPVMGGR